MTGPSLHILYIVLHNTIELAHNSFQVFQSCLHFTPVYTRFPFYFILFFVDGFVNVLGTIEKSVNTSILFTFTSTLKHMHPQTHSNTDMTIAEFISSEKKSRKKSRFVKPGTLKKFNLSGTFLKTL